MIGTFRNSIRHARKSLGFEAFYRRHIRRYVKQDKRAGKILTPDIFLGAAAQTLAPEVEEKIIRHLDKAFATQAPMPIGLNDLKTCLVKSSRPVKALIVMQQYINGDPAQLESDFVFHFTHSAVAAGIKTANFYSDHCMYTIKDSDMARRQQEKLRKTILDQQPDLVVFDGNFMPGPQGINPSWWTALKVEQQFKLVTVIGDSYAPLPDFLGAWESVSDLSVIFCRRSTYGHAYMHSDRLLKAPTLPFAEAFISRAAPDIKDVAFCCIGSSTRHRPEFCAMVPRTALSSKIILHNRFKKETVSMEDYINILRRSKTVFNTGFVNSQTSIVTFRAFEAIVCKAVLLEENGEVLSDYFIPWRHFIPVNNAHEVAIYAQFFAKNEKYRSRIAEEAYSMFHLHYSSIAFWNKVFEKNLYCS